jgi:cell volume regulation protein A
MLLGLSRAAVPSRVAAALEVESGLNDPMSVFLTVVLVDLLTRPSGLDAGRAALLFLEEMGGGAALGLVSGYTLLWLFRWQSTPPVVSPVLAVGGALAIFGGAQVVGASGFLAVYLAGLIVGNHDHPARQSVTRFFGTLGWLAQIALFLMLGLLVTPHELPSMIAPALVLSAALILVARPVAVIACLLPFGWTMREAVFVAWVGLRGAVPIYLTIIPLLADVRAGQILFDVVFVVVIVSVAIQGWTITPAAQLLGLRADDPVTALGGLRLILSETEKPRSDNPFSRIGYEASAREYSMTSPLTIRSTQSRSAWNSPRTASARLSRAEPRNPSSLPTLCWRRESRANPSLKCDSLVTGKNTGKMPSWEPRVY